MDNAQAYIIFVDYPRFLFICILKDSVRAFKERLKLGQFKDVSPEEEEKKRQKEKQDQEEAEAIKVGSRCEVHVGGKKRGVVMFVGG